MNLNCINNIDCQQGAVRAVRFNGKHLQYISIQNLTQISLYKLMVHIV